LDVFDAYGVQFLVLDTLRDGHLLRLVRSRADWTVDFRGRPLTTSYFRV
jgi:hypothetical protein